ncbi:MAG: hypothetical protein AAFN74_15085, partial [Myxococcota bacterium]
MKQVQALDRNVWCRPAWVAALAMLGLSGTACVSEAEYKIGLVTFLSGGAAGPFGIPARNAGELVIDAINAGTMPAPYNGKGIAGKPIRPVWVD